MLLVLELLAENPLDSSSHYIRLLMQEDQMMLRFFRVQALLYLVQGLCLRVVFVELIESDLSSEEE